jgi:hypothetical protein
MLPDKSGFGRLSFKACCSLLNSNRGGTGNNPPNWGLDRRFIRGKMGDAFLAFGIGLRGRPVGNIMNPCHSSVKPEIRAAAFIRPVETNRVLS